MLSSNKLLEKNTEEPSEVTVQKEETNSFGKIKNWYEDRYSNILIQRNFIFFLLVISLLSLLVAAIAIMQISSLKQFDPFVISIQENTGAATIVNAMDTSVLSQDESLAKYFIKQYVAARESYNPVNFGSITKNIIRLLSSDNLFWQYMSFIKQNDPSKLYGDKNSTRIITKSWSKLESNKYVLRFTVQEEQGNQKSYNKIAIIDIRYVSMQLTPEELDINPVGFQITGYKVDDDNS